MGQESGGGGLAAYQLRIATALADPADTHPGAAITRWAIHGWAVRGLSTVAPLTTLALHRADRLEAEVRAQIALGARPQSLHAWAAAFTTRLAADPDPTVAAVATIEASVL
jgi:hypothetical protein